MVVAVCFVAETCGGHFVHVHLQGNKAHDAVDFRIVDDARRQLVGEALIVLGDECGVAV